VFAKRQELFRRKLEGRLQGMMPHRIAMLLRLSLVGTDNDCNANPWLTRLTEAIAAYKKVSAEKQDLETKSAEGLAIRNVLAANGLFTSGDLSVLAAELESNQLKLKEAQRSMSQQSTALVVARLGVLGVCKPHSHTFDALALRTTQALCRYTSSSSRTMN
jgi:hypothetical protein